MSYPLRDKVPVRTCAKTYTDHTKYKPYLRDDFNKKCGYCDDHDAFVGGPDSYHVDHFVPAGDFPHLSATYSNLVYSCRYCNRAKWNKWPSKSEHISVVNNEGFVDPCNVNYDTHFERDLNGDIVALTELGNYMHENLHLRLERHAILWNLNRIQDQRDILKASISGAAKLNEKQKKMLTDLESSFDDFFKKLQNSYDN